jgi:hypothetical protein
VYQNSILQRILTVTVSGLLLCGLYLAGSDTAFAQRTEEIVVAPIDSEGEATATVMTREELEDRIRRFADRFTQRVATAANVVRAQSETPAEYLLMQEWKSATYTAIWGISIGPNAVTNLLDMIVVTTLSRIVVEEYWVPEVIGESEGEPLVTAYRILEGEIWKIADAVLSAEQQDDLRFMIKEWRDANPSQTGPYYMRFGAFSGQRAARLNSLKKSGGLLKEVARARESAEEIQELGERMFFYLQRAPIITSIEFENSILEVLGGPEMVGVLRDLDRFVVAVEELVDVVKKLPSNRLAAVDQLMERVSEQRKAFLQDILDLESATGEPLTELRQSIEAFERIVNELNQGETSGEPFDIDKYRETAAETGKAITELRLLTEGLDGSLGNSSNISDLIDELASRQVTVLNRLFLMLAALIFIFFAAMLGYRYLSSRLFST